MDADQFVARWVMIIYDELGHGKPQPWKDGLPLGASFEISKDAFGSYWYLPSPELKAPMDQPCKLHPSDEKHGEFDVGELLPGSLYADFGGRVGRLFFSINLINRSRRVISLSQSHGGSHGTDY
ncbi:MAG TPA: hypothetical protein VFR29_04995 [Steroidobacteraceae bacterium]|nr:hypothetical protein [Steroidobacteraceae bacterium]